ncbi:general substrate transporter [Lineolata rhizophorae]|uniref:General substrate transporter n=1 Tax=Lineolata rhizophorae TaxID=578093 RepID=A0A6A6NQ53_9PEZI|nr:general substrate transporter [Lineolata rhizophorae]
MATERPSKDEAASPVKPEQKSSEHIEMVPVAGSDAGQDDVKLARGSWYHYKKDVIVSVIIMFSAFEYGLDIGMVSGFQAMAGFLEVFGYEDPTQPGGYGLKTIVQTLMTSLMVMGGFLGAFAAGAIMDFLGRRSGLWVGSGLTLLGAILQMTVTSYAGLYVCRIILGLGNGVLLVSGQVFMQEVANPQLRTASFGTNQFWMAFGQLIGAIINNATKTHAGRSAYQTPMGILCVMPVLMSVALIFIPETPRYLQMRGKHEAARRSLRWHRDRFVSDAEVEAEYSEIAHPVESERDAAGKSNALEIFHPRNLKRTLTSMGLVLFPAATGVSFMGTYGVYFFEVSGSSDPFVDGVIVLACNLAGAICTIAVGRRMRKRISLLVAAAVQALCMLGMGVSYVVHGLSPFSGRVILSMACIFCYISTFISIPFSWQIGSEIPNPRFRAPTYGIGTGVAFVVGWAQAYSLPYFINTTALNWGGKVGFLFLAGNVVVVGFVFLCVPETKGRTLEEINECYVLRVPVRKWDSYEAQGAKNARREGFERGLKDQGK